MCVAPIIVSEPSEHITLYVLSLAADRPYGLPSSLGNFPQDVAILGHKVLWASQGTTPPHRDVILAYPAPFVKYKRGRVKVKMPGD